MALTSVHDAIQNAKLEAHKPDMKVISFRAEVPKIDIVMQMCDREGISLAAFLRACIDGWIDDQCPPPKQAK